MTRMKPMRIMPYIQFLGLIVVSLFLGSCAVATEQDAYTEDFLVGVWQDDSEVDRVLSLFPGGSARFELADTIAYKNWELQDGIFLVIHEHAEGAGEHVITEIYAIEKLTEKNLILRGQGKEYSYTRISKMFLLDP